MAFWVCLAGFINGIVWFIYASLKSVDLYFVTGNGIGADFGLFQLFVYAYYNVKAKRSGSVQSEVKQAERQIGETSLNEVSSRSHQIINQTDILFCRQLKARPGGIFRASALAADVNFVHLAGSERASQALSTGTRLKEGCHINRSLLTLGTVIRKLRSGNHIWISGSTRTYRCTHSWSVLDCILHYEEKREWLLA
ncbi:ATP binding microtubule motor family protein [Perilla frutescens var. hirtella]|nr:ATP binding microtubule motor family protein [Perilla frutescens var. hirtella]